MNEVKLILIAYFILMTGIGIYSAFRIKNASDYYISGKRGSWWQVSGSLFATIMGGSAILGTVELSQKAGWAAIWFLTSASVGLIVLAFITARVSRLGHYTLPEMIRLFYGEKAERTATIIIPVAWTGVIAVQIIAGARTLSGLQLMSYEEGTLVCAAAFILYTLIGGQVSILKTDFIQALIIITAMVALFVIRLHHPWQGEIPYPRGTDFFNESFTLTDLVFLLFTYSVTFMVGPDIYSRIFCAKNEKTARSSVILVAIIVIPMAFILTFLGVSSASEAGNIPTNGFILPGTSFLPPWALGLLAAAMLSAVMSSADTTLLTSSTILSEMVTGNLDKRDSWKTTRLFVIILGGLSLLISIHITSILNAMLLSLALFSGAFILPVIAGIAGWKVNKQFVFAGMAVGGITALAGKIVHDNIPGEWGLLMIIAAFLLNGAFLFYPSKSAQKT